MFGLTGWVNNVVSGAADVVTGGAAGIIENAVQKIQEGKPLDALAGVVTGGPVGAVLGATQAVGGIIEGVTGDKTVSQAVAGVKAPLNTLGGAVTFAVAAVGLGAAAGGKVEPPKIPGLSAATSAKSAETQMPSGKTLEVLSAGKAASSPTVAPKKKRRVLIAGTVGVGILGALVAAFAG